MFNESTHFKGFNESTLQHMFDSEEIIISVSRNWEAGKKGVRDGKAIGVGVRT